MTMSQIGFGRRIYLPRHIARASKHPYASLDLHDITSSDGDRSHHPDGHQSSRVLSDSENGGSQQGE